MKHKLYWWIAVVIILPIGVSEVYSMPNIDTEVYSMPNIDTEPIFSHKVLIESLAKSTVLKKPPPGETYGTGHWHGDSWHRTAPPEPEEVYGDGEMLTYEELGDKMRRRLGGAEKYYEYCQIAIAGYPYSELALKARYSLLNRDTLHNYNSTLELSRKKEMLKYHPDSPRLLSDLLHLTGVMEEDSPEEAIEYGKEALKYVNLYPVDSPYRFGTYPAEIHNELGYAYQRIGDYKSALVHLKATQSLVESHPGRLSYGSPNLDIVVSLIQHIEEDRPLYGPTIPGLEDIEVPDFPFPDDFDFESDTPVAMAEIFESSDVPDELLRSEHIDASVALQRARDRLEFGEFLRWIEEIESVKSPIELKDFLMHEMAINLVGGNTAFSPDRLIHAFETFQYLGDTEGIKHLQKFDPEIAKMMGHKPPQGLTSNKVSLINN